MTIQNILTQNKQDIINRINSGESLNSIAKSMNINSGNLWFFIKDNKIELKKKMSKNYGKVESRKDEIVALYNQGKSAYSISKQLGISRPVILSKLKKWGYDTSRYDDNKNKNRPLLKDMADEILLLHYSGFTHKEIAEEIKCSSSEISKMLTKLGITDNYYKKYSVDHTFFQTIDTQEKAYILGWWYSDGNVRKPGLIRIQLAQDDKEILEKIAGVMQYDGPLRTLPPPAKFPHRKIQTLLAINSIELT